MSTTQPSHPGEIPAELDAGFVAALADFDERLRRGEQPAVDTEAMNPPTFPGRRAEQCLALLEAAWPRSERPAFGDLTESWISQPRRIARFDVIRMIGGGGFSLVYLARDPDLNRYVAIKVPRPHLLMDEEVRRRFLREAQAIGTLDHPNIVHVHESGSVGPAVYLAMAYCEGPSLADWLSRQSEPIPVRLAVEIVARLADAIRYSHKCGVLHRDLKPANVLLFPTHGNDQQTIGCLPFTPKVADFGLAKLLEGALEDTRSSVVLGTPLYMAPEQATGNTRLIGSWTDIYGLGAILHELLTGQPPFSGDNVLAVLERLREAEPIALVTLRPDVPRDLQTICGKCLLKDPADRYANAQALYDDLQNFLHDRPITARPLGMVSKAVRIARKPARVRDAGIYTLCINAALTVWVLIAATTAYLQLGPVSGSTDILKGYLTGVASGTIFAVLPIYFGWMILKRRAWAALASAISGLAATCYTMTYVCGLVLIDYGGQYNDPNSRILVFTLLSVLFFGQAVLGFLAYCVLRRETHGM